MFPFSRLIPTLFSILLLGLFVTPVIAQPEPVPGEEGEEKEVSPFLELQKGWRAQVITDKGMVFRGQIFYVSENRLIIDVSLEHPELNGRIGFMDDNVRRVDRLRSLTEKEREEILARKEALRKELEAELAQLQAERAALKEKISKGDDAEDSSSDAETGMMDSEQTDKALALLQEYPPKDGWGKERYDWLSRKFVVTGVALSESEQKYVDNYDLWKAGLAYLESQKEKYAESQAKEGEEGEKSEDSSSETSDESGNEDSSSESDSSGPKAPPGGVPSPGAGNPGRR